MPASSSMVRVCILQIRTFLLSLYH